ncbi:MAG: hypothetical protein WCI52_01885 [bacterium]
MNKKVIIAIIFVALILVVGVLSVKKTPSQNKNHNQTPIAFDGKNTSFEIDGSTVNLVNGVSEISVAPGSASKITTRYFGNEARGDLNGDGLDDVAFIVTQDGGGSGTFYYVVVALKNLDGYKNTNAFLIGDRIAPQTLEINTSAKELYVNFAERKPGEPMSVEPSVGATMILKVTPSGVLEGLMK